MLWKNLSELAMAEQLAEIVSPLSWLVTILLSPATALKKPLTCAVKEVRLVLQVLAVERREVSWSLRLLQRLMRESRQLVSELAYLTICVQAQELLVLHCRTERQRLAMSLAVQMLGADCEMRLLREMQSEPVGGKQRPLVVSTEGVQVTSEPVLVQFAESNTQQSLEHVVFTDPPPKVRRFRLASATVAGKTIRDGAEAQTVHLIDPSDYLSRRIGGIHVKRIARSLHVQIGLGISECLSHGLHLICKVKFLEYVAIIEEANVQIIEEFVEGASGGRGKAYKTSLGLDCCSEVLAEIVAEASDCKEHHENGQHCEVTEPQANPTEMHESPAGQQPKQMSGQHSQESQQARQHYNSKHCLGYYDSLRCSQAGESTVKSID